jgi:hypothetical protein
MKKYFLSFVLFLSLGYGQEVATQPITDVDALIEVISASTQELLLVTDVFRNEAVSDAVKDALLKRGVKVYVLAPQDLVTDLSSYFGTLSEAGAVIHTQEATGAFLVIDRKYVVQGPMLGGLPKGQPSTPTMLVASPEYANHLAGLFIDAFEGGEAWSYEVQ